MNPPPLKMFRACASTNSNSEAPRLWRIPLLRAAPIAAITLLAATMFPAGAAHADGGFPPGDAAPAVTTTAPTSAPATKWTELLSTATNSGSVPVLVKLTAKARPEHTLSGSDRASQRKALKSASSAVVRELGHTPKHLKTSELMPLLAFDATTADLKRLQRSSRVAAVSEDMAYALPVESTGNTGPKASTPAQAPKPGPVTAPAGTSSNGYSNALPAYWDFYRIGVDVARRSGWAGNGQSVAVLDTGVDAAHNWIYPRVVNQTCFSRAAHCPNRSTQMYGVGAAAPCTFSTACAHGTHVAHTAAGRNGVAANAKILAIQVFSSGTRGPTTYDSDLVWAMSHVYNVRASYRIAAVNMSLGGGLYTAYCDSASDGTVGATAMRDWMNALKAVGIATVVASGNNNSSTALARPGCVSTAISVGNTTNTSTNADAVFGYVTGGSNSNAYLDLLAPGTDICSAVPVRFNAAGYDCSYYGTSMAAPHVAGALAVLRQYRPTASVDQMHTALRTGGVGVVDSRNGVNRSRISVPGALNRL